MPTTTTPFGLRDIKVTAYTDEAATTLASTSVDLPNSQSLSFSIDEDSEELRGDDMVVASEGKGEEVEWELAAGGLSYDAVRVMLGGTITVTGTAPNQVTTYTKTTENRRPYFKIQGKAISSTGGDQHVEMDRCKASGKFEFELKDGEFAVSELEGKALPSKITGADGQAWRLIHNETSKDIA